MIGLEDYALVISFVSKTHVGLLTSMYTWVYCGTCPLLFEVDGSPVLCPQFFSEGGVEITIVASGY